ncbi:putative helicase with zinc finger domain [Babylonia areolata]|uniref:putative helicase with zinc finger domain n=1 Tax=Babylonia areolata TaxID=304850 RepID=UPI003FD4CB16
MDDEGKRYDNLGLCSIKRPEKTGGPAVEGLDTVRSYAASDDPFAMQNSGERGASGSTGAQGEVDPEVWDTINNLSKQKKHREVVALCDQVLEADPKNDKILEKKVRALCQSGKFRRAFNVASKWLQESPDHPVAIKELKRLKTVLEALEGQFSEEEDDKETEPASAASNRASSSHKVDSFSKPVPRNTVRVLPPQPQNRLTKQNNEEQKHFCSFCDMHFDRQEELDAHCQSDLHKKRLASDESQEWKYRPPPRGQTTEDYMLCHRFYETQRCPYGEKCTHAHSEAELEEWKERFAFRKQQLQQARDKLLHGNTFVDQLLEKLTHPDGPQARLVQNLDFVKIHVNSDLKVNMSTKKCTNAWTFTMASKICMHAVGLMDAANRTYFHISSISVGPKKTQKYQNLENHCQEWVNQDTANKGQGEYVYRVKIVFKTDIYGTFRQQMALGFGLDTVVVRDVQVESCPATDPEKLGKDLELSAARRWSPDSVTVVPFSPPYTTRTDTEEQLLAKYVLPRPERLSLSETVMQSLSKDNYRLWMHEMLYLEEMAELGYIQRFNVTGSLQLVNRFLLMPGALSQAKYSREGELFARLRFEDVLSEDSSAGRLILQNAHSAWVAPAPPADGSDAGQKAKIKVYEAHIEEKGKNFVFLRLSAECVKDLNLTCDEVFAAQIQFQLNRLPKCEMHSAVDNLSTLNIVFPDNSNVTALPPPSENVLSKLDGVLLNNQQREAILTITSPVKIKHPPLLIIGPFGTGKTYTLAQAAKLVLEQEDTRILICTHSNSAADLYIKDFLHPYVEEGNEHARPLRVYYRHRWVNTVPDVIIPYSLWSSEKFMFVPPTLEDVKKHRIIITTLSTARYISDIGLPSDFFSHIFIDEAAQALECETLIPMSLADEKTRVVLAGDHMQISPEVYSDYTRQQGFHISFLERLYDLYPSQSPCMVMLCENYRSHKAIVDFTSDLFYDHRLLASGKQSPHPTFYPLTFCHAKGLEEQHANSTGFYNLSEVYEIVDRVDELRKKWPEDWGDMDNNISVVAPYHDQVIRIRNELRKKKIHNVSVERVLNVQGKQYRVIIISAVRTRNSCRTDSSAEEEYLDYGFLSNVKLLNTAITRAQSLVMVVGDPLSLCLVGKCRKVWEYFLEICHQNDSLFGITWTQLRSSLDRVEVAKSYVLNPLAPEFVPNRRFHFTSQAHEQTAGSVVQQGGAPMPYLVNPYLPAMQPNPYQMFYPHMMPYYNMPIYSPYMGPVFMRAPSASGVRFGHHRSLPRPNFQHAAVTAAAAAAATQRAEGVRMVDMSHSIRSPSRHPPRGGRMPFFHLPRVPLHYALPQLHPMFSQTPHLPQPGFYMSPEEARLASLQSQLPLYHPYPYLPPQLRASQQASPHVPGTHFHQGAPLHVHAHSPASATTLSPPGRTTPGDENHDSLSSPEASRSGNAIGMSDSGHGFQVLPNVKHVPAHLMRGGLQSSSQNSSRSSTPINTVDRPLNPVPPYLQEGHAAPISERPYSPANYGARGSPHHMIDETHRDRSGSRERDVVPTEADISSQLAGLHTAERTTGSNSGSKVMNTTPPVTKKVNNPKKLSLKTGFSRQFSDDLPTPTAITEIVRMIEENIDECVEESDSSSSPEVSSQRAQILSRLNGRNAALSSLQLDLVAAQQRQQQQAAAEYGTPQSASSSGSAATLNGERAPFAGIGDTAAGGDSLMPDICHMEPQTPRTPSGFVTPGGELATVDPDGILKSLNIGPTVPWGTALQQSDESHSQL